MHVWIQGLREEGHRAYSLLLLPLYSLQAQMGFNHLLVRKFLLLALSTPAPWLVFSGRENASFLGVHIEQVCCRVFRAWILTPHCPGSNSISVP